GTGSYYPTPSGKFAPIILAADTAVYQNDAPLDLLGLATAQDQIDGDISGSIKITNDGGFSQDIPGAYKVTYSVTNSSGETTEKTITVTVKEVKTAINGHDSTIYVGDQWTAVDNFDSAVDKDGNRVEFKDITVTGNVD
ncbi:TPA: bacterial Ig-like domain-containing protein, partial [Aeromonas salmonicida]|nr:bacterial Ig-like domain-containing protein [Aeromonas salmonicida]